LYQRSIVSVVRFQNITLLVPPDCETVTQPVSTNMAAQASAVTMSRRGRRRNDEFPLCISLSLWFGAANLSLPHMAPQAALTESPVSPVGPCL
jgi:hypothetical protein